MTAEDAGTAAASAEGHAAIQIKVNIIAAVHGRTARWWNNSIRNSLKA
jgi:hypothetical protein